MPSSLRVLLPTAALQLCSALSGALRSSEGTLQDIRLGPAASTQSRVKESLGITVDSEDRCQDAAEGSNCFNGIMWLKSTGFNRHPDWYPGYNSESLFQDVQALLNTKGIGQCPKPCAVTSAERKELNEVGIVTNTEYPGYRCHDAVEGDRCFRAVQWIMTKGIVSRPEWYPSLNASSPSYEVQGELNRRAVADCPRPCAGQAPAEKKPKSDPSAAQPPRRAHKHVHDMNASEIDRYIKGEWDGTMNISEKEAEEKEAEEARAAAEEEQALAEEDEEAQAPADTSEEEQAPARTSEEALAAEVDGMFGPETPATAQPAEATNATAEMAQAPADTSAKEHAPANASEEAQAPADTSVEKTPEVLEAEMEDIFGPETPDSSVKEQGPANVSEEAQAANGSAKEQALANVSEEAQLAADASAQEQALANVSEEAQVSVVSPWQLPIVDMDGVPAPQNTEVANEAAPGSASQEVADGTAEGIWEAAGIDASGSVTAQQAEESTNATVEMATSTSAAMEARAEMEADMEAKAMSNVSNDTVSGSASPEVADVTASDSVTTQPAEEPTDATAEVAQAPADTSAKEHAPANASEEAQTAADTSAREQTLANVSEEAQAVANDSAKEQEPAEQDDPAAALDIPELAEMASWLGCTQTEILRAADVDIAAVLNLPQDVRPSAVMATVSQTDLKHICHPASAAQETLANASEETPANASEAPADAPAKEHARASSPPLPMVGMDGVLVEASVVANETLSDILSEEGVDVTAEAADVNASGLNLTAAEMEQILRSETPATVETEAEMEAKAMSRRAQAEKEAEAKEVARKLEELAAEGQARAAARQKEMEGIRAKMEANERELEDI